MALHDDHENIQKIGLPLTPGAPTVHTFERYLSDITLAIAKNRTELKESGVNFAIPEGTASLIRHEDRISLITAAHVLTEIKGKNNKDLAVLNHPALDLKMILPDELYVSSLDPTAKSSDLVGKTVRIYFHRTACTEEERVGATLVYEFTPTVYDEKKDQLYANTPNDFGDYMGAVSGAGVYLDDKIVGVFLGRGCAEGLPNNGCSGAEGKTAYLRFVGIDSLRGALEESVAAGVSFPLIIY